MSKLRRTALLATAFLAFTTLAEAAPQHGIAMLGEPALPPDFKHLPYANPDAPQGGDLRQAVTGSFDSVNPFIVKGQSAMGPRTYVFESLLGRNWDEPFSLYGLLAETIDVSDDRQTFTFKIRPDAKFSDGTPVTAADVVFSMETLRDKGRPNFKNSYSKITKAETPDEHTVTFHQEAGDRELPLIMGLMPIFPRAQWQDKDFAQTTLDPLMGSGPYVMEKIKAGETITYRRNPDYWGKDLPIGKGLWNFDTVRFDYYRDANAAFEAFKSGLADVRIETDPKRWNTGYDFPAVKDGKITLEKVEQKTPAPASGFIFNTRRPIFEDPRVREALVMAFDFEWANANLFSNAYHRTYGYYGGSELSSEGKPVDDAEKAVLGDALAKLRPDFVDGSYRLPVSDGSGRDRKLLRKAVALLAEAGWTMSDKGLVNAKGEPFSFTILVKDRDQEKIALHYQRTLAAIGITATVRIIDAAQFTALQNTYDYDMIPATWFNSLSPGNEQVLYFGSEGRTVQGTRNYPGIADPAVDHAIQSMLDAKTREDFVAAVRAEDRLLTSGFYMVPLYDAGGQWVARWNTIGRPDAQPLTGFEATTLWRNK
ncbi:ABC transporter substrate-binding protein [Aestuariivirga litoralis]|uniref:ABC transporter substrate-binding protein n=1 Tax=Aestuariivirga litoralis TaxID=2650924 RepID=A0A2W2BKN0_9HYPH|nr:extracellular solute-binding protein [Aestuariivirga litoralis]PZF76769.1 ABC transporter substrate-binding protein [Aestuariivirga litoralis]